MWHKYFINIIDSEIKELAYDRHDCLKPYKNKKAKQ